MKKNTDAETKPLRLLIVDDHAVLRESLRLVLDGEADLVVAGEAENAAAAREACRSNTFDVILLGVRLPDQPGHELARMLKSDGCKAEIIGLSMRDEQRVRQQMMAAGAAAFVSKAAGAEKLIETIRACAGRTGSSPKAG